MDFNFISLVDPIFWIKIITLIVIGFYVVFTFVVFTQVRIMAQILHLSHGQTIIKTIAIIHIILAVSLFLGAFVIL